VQMSHAIKNTLADLKLNVHIQGALAALSLQMTRTASGQTAIR
jgi:hypothetical protein